MNTTTKVKPPTWFWIASIAGLVWNCLGVAAYLSQAYMTEEMTLDMSEAELNFMEATPAWVTGVFAIAVWGGLLGCIALLIRKKWATPVFLVSLLAILIQMGYYIFMTNSKEVFGIGQAVIQPLLVVLIGILLYLFAKMATRRNWLA